MWKDVHGSGHHSQEENDERQQSGYNRTVVWVSIPGTTEYEAGVPLIAPQLSFSGVATTVAEDIPSCTVRTAHEIKEVHFLNFQKFLTLILKFLRILRALPLSKFHSFILSFCLYSESLLQVFALRHARVCRDAYGTMMN
jgi:hypothetical protein